MGSIRGEPERGQATVDYVGLIAVLAILLAAAAAVVVVGAPGFVNSVVAQVHRALCIVTADTCEVKRPAPCTLASRRDSDHFAINVAILRFGTDGFILRERLSDGTVRLTSGNRKSGGFELGIGARLQLSKDTSELGAGGEARVGGEAVLGNGQIFIARDDDEAGAIVRALRGEGGRTPPPSATYLEGGVRLIGKLGLAPLIASAGLDSAAEAIIGVRRDRVSGTTTFTLNLGEAANVLLQALLSGPAKNVGLQAVLGLTVDRGGRPVELSLLGAGEHESGASETVKRGLEGRRIELTARADLTDPDIAAAWGSFAAARSVGTLVALARQLQERAQLEVRQYATSSSTSGPSGGIGALFRLGAESTDTIELARLRSAMTRPPGGLWEPRLDCLPMVA